MLVAACTKMTMSAAEEERCRVLLAKLKEAIDKRGVLLDKLGKVMDETVSSLASSTSLLVCGAADSTPNSTATNKVPAMANAAPSANTTLTNQAPPRCSTMCPDHSIDMPLSDCTTAVAPTSSSTIATLEIGNTFIANTVLVKSTECSKECEEQAVDTDHCVAAAGICAVASTNCLMECPRLVAGDSGVTNLIIVGSVTRIMGLQLKPPWPPPQGPETVLKLFHKQAQNIMMKVSGEFNFESGGSIHSLPKLRLNPYSWSKVSSVIYLHSPAGVGLSYSKNVSDYQTGDLKTAADSHTFLLKWFQRYPEFLSNPFYIAGESYAGVYVPTLSHEVIKGIQGGVKPTINFKGYMVGNGVCDTVFDGNALVPFAHGMGLISDDIYQEAGTACQGNYWNASTAKCEKALSKVDTEINELNIHDILEPCYHSTNVKVIPHKRLISMYVDSVTITNARRVFDGIKYKDIITWNSVISAFAQLGDLHQVLNLLSLMTEEMDPDDFTFAIVLAASANSATVQLRYAYAINVMDISGMLLSQAANSDPECANDILGAVLAACGRNVYELLSDFDWYVSLLTDRARSLHCAQGNEIGRQLVDVGLRVQDAQPELVHSARTLLIDPTLLGKLCPVLYAAAWVYGEYVNFIKDPVELVEALLQPRTSLLPMSVRAVYIQAVPKVITFCCALYVKRLNDSNKEVDVVFDGLVIDQTVSRGSDVAIGEEQIVMPSTVEKDPFSHKLIVYMIELIERTVGPLVKCNEVEVLERARNLIGLVHLLREIQELKERNVGDDDKHSRVKDYVKNMQTVFSQELGPVSANAPVILSSTLSECDFPNPALYCEQGDMDSRGSESMKQNMVSENLVQQKYGGDWVLVRLSRNVLLVP